MKIDEMKSQVIRIGP